MKEKRGVSIQLSSSFEIKTSQQEQYNNKSSYVVEKKWKDTTKTQNQTDSWLDSSTISSVTKKKWTSSYPTCQRGTFMLYAWWWWLSLLLCLLNNHITYYSFFSNFHSCYFLFRVLILCVCVWRDLQQQLLS